MASISNRSRYFVSVKNSPDRTKEFGFRRLEEALTYLEELKREFKSAELSRADDCFLVRFREPGKKAHSRHVKSRQEARELIKFVDAHSGIDTQTRFTLGSVTFAELADLYIEEVCPFHKGGKVEAYTLSSMLRDAGYETRLELRRQEKRAKRRLASEEAKRIAAAKPKNKNMARSRKKKEDAAPAVKKAARKRSHVRWMTKSVCDITGEEIQRFSNANTGILTTDEADLADAGTTVVKPGTMDRELDLVSQVLRWAFRKKGVEKHNDPMAKVDRPKFNNERNVRLLDGEEERLVDAAYDEDKIQSRERTIKELLKPARLNAAELDASLSSRKRVIAASREEIEGSLKSFKVIPIYSGLIVFLLATAARRGEALNLSWKNTNLEKGTAFFPETKNGASRTVPLRAHLVELLTQLKACRDPNEERVFPVTRDSWDGAWRRIRERAGLDEVFRRHDLRHEAISQIAKAGHLSGMPFDAITLASITGHRDLRSLQRYLNLHKGRLAKHMDYVFAVARERGQMHKGRPHLKRDLERELLQGVAVFSRANDSNSGFEMSSVAARPSENQ